MIFHILIGQRKCAYPGQYAPEALEVMDDNGMSDNPEFMSEKMEYYQRSREFDSIVIMKVGVADSHVDRVLFPNTEVKGMVL